MDSSFRLDELRRDSWLRGLVYEPQMPSTNDLALRLAADAALGAPTLVLTAQQTAGRGRGVNRWWSAPGALTCSVVIDLPASLPVLRRSQLALVAGLAVRQAVAQQAGVVAWVKWPNDVYVDRRKVGGILIETSASRPTRAVIGIGINVNNSLAEAPLDVQGRAAALVDLAGRPLDLTNMLTLVLRRLSAEIQAWVDDEKVLSERWGPHCFLTGRAVQIEGNGTRIVGRCLGISPTGALLLQTSEGVVPCIAGVVARFDEI